jgi:hypothetical protein
LIGHAAGTSSPLRNFYLAAARELDGSVDYSLRISLDASDQIAAKPAPRQKASRGKRFTNGRAQQPARLRH